MGFYYITVATKPHEVLDNLQKRVEKQGEQLIVLGLHEDRYIGWHAAGNFGIKLREVKDFIMRPDLDDDDVVLFTDAYDVIYYGNQEEIIRRYLKLNKPVVFGCEKFCNPIPSYASKFDFKDTEFPYLNSGLFIGRVYALRKCMENYKYEDKHDDQVFWMDAFFKYPDLIGLDYKNSLFFNTVGVDLKTIIQRDGKCYYKDAIPQFVHINGPDKTEVKLFVAPL